MAGIATNKPINTIILDAGPIIKNDPSVSTLIARAERLITVPSIISEIRDAVTRSRVETTLLPFLSQRTPKPSSINFIREFSRKTGDLAVLSQPDVQILALTYELECELNGGDWRLRNEPGQKRMNGAPPGKTSTDPTEGLQEVNGDLKESPVLSSDAKSAERHVNVTSETSNTTTPTTDATALPIQVANAEKYVESNDETITEVSEGLQKTVLSEAHNDEHQRLSTGENPQNASTTDQSMPENKTENVSEASQQQVSAEIPDYANNPDTTTLSNPEHVTDQSSHDSKDNSEPSQPDPLDHPPQPDPLNNPPTSDVSPSESSESDSEGWITPSNIHRHHQAHSSSPRTSTAQQQPTLQAALLTTDHAMQNTALQLNLNLVAASSTLQPITQVRTTVLRCHACFATARDTARQFCARCGAQGTLTRVSSSTDARTGAVKLHLKTKGWQWSTRGNRYAVPKPVEGSASGKKGKEKGAGGGKGGWGQGLILAEDQKEYVRAVGEERRRQGKERDWMDEDVVPGIVSGERGGGGGGWGTRPKVGAGRYVNSRRR
ncbi:MAG: Nin1 binding protein [Bathelium mastoideum]|nr:MAG: Nin1 binding protein [Bathelium mastoideum]